MHSYAAVSVNLLYGFGQFILYISASLVAQYFKCLVKLWHSEGREREQARVRGAANHSACLYYCCTLERTGTEASWMSHSISASLLASSAYFLQIKSSKSVYLIRGYTTYAIGNSTAPT